MLTGWVHRLQVFALNAGIAGIFAPAAAPIVGWICEDTYGWDSSSFGSCDLKNAQALGALTHRSPSNLSSQEVPWRYALQSHIWLA